VSATAVGQNIDSIAVREGSNSCNPGTPVTAPPETRGLIAAANKSTFSWSAEALATNYDAVRGTAAELPVGPGGGDEVCFGGLGGPSLDDPSAPPPGTVYWYLSRGINGCGAGPYGDQGLHGGPGAPRVTTTCP
jgi:hypothetical protein